ncbi:MAG: TniQ family protein [Gallionella sp.]
MPNSSPIWVCHPKPLPDELLTSWMVRIAHGHSMKLQTFFRVSLGKGQEIWSRDVDRQTPEWLVRALSEHTGVGTKEIEQTSLLAYTQVLYQVYRWSGYQAWILPLKMRATSYRHHGVQFCPQCLAEDHVPYFRKRWRVAFYTTCTKHNCMLHDRCPSCSAPVAFHRGEMGKFSLVNSGPITLCHVCGFDLRGAQAKPPVIYDESAHQIFLPALRLLEGAADIDPHYDVGFFSVFHQLCKSMLTHYSHVKLRQFVTEKIGAPEIQIGLKHEPIESYSLEDRHVVIQLAMWILADPETRIIDAWHHKAIRYNVLKKDFHLMPEWYQAVVERCADWRGEAGL